MDQHTFPALDTFAREADAFIEHLSAGGFHVGCREMQKADAVLLQCAFIVATFSPQIDDRPDAVLMRELARPFDRESPADRQRIRQPMEVQAPTNWIEGSIFFFRSWIARDQFLTYVSFYCCYLLDYCCFTDDYCSFALLDGTTKLSNCSASV